MRPQPAPSGDGAPSEVRGVTRLGSRRVGLFGPPGVIRLVADGARARGPATVVHEHVAGSGTVVGDIERAVVPGPVALEEVRHRIGPARRRGGGHHDASAPCARSGGMVAERPVVAEYRVLDAD